ncbi:PREDICTED: uncharacterized protein LOC109187551 [Ipomoea nil]|uniref:uncharacterized protein LOC109187551 n=1 Tax=Ipomoea nil TaxID=35883 RepID=UPI0009014B6A|nr:PREDICTED: uncharacterized protein LOC109187551 [Ipomoea nil]
MAWRTPAVNTMATGSNIPNPAPVPNRAYDPKDRVDPLHLHPNESPSLQFVTAQLEGRSNYHPWARVMEIALRSKNKLVFVDDTMAAPVKTDPRYFYWDQCNTMVLSWILRAVLPTIGRSVLWINIAKGIWKDLKKRSSQQDVFRIAEIQTEIYQIKQGNSSINDYFTQLKLNWDELSVLRPTPSCECSPSCECGRNVSEKVRAHLENDMLSSFLIGLNEKFSNTKRQIMLMKPLPDVGEAFAMVSQQERSFLGQKQKPVCSYCGYTGHTIDKCYKKHGYPPGWKSRNKNSGSVNQAQAVLQEEGTSQSIPSIHQEDFRRFLEFMQYERVNNTPLSIGPQANAIAASFVPDSRLEGKVANPSCNNLTKSGPLWILDSGATHHIVCNMNLLQNPIKVEGILFDLPNGSQAQVSHTGTAQLSVDMVLLNVLCVPVFQYNLISLGELTTRSSCHILFHSNKCIIQDQHPGKMICMAELKKGLYQLMFPVLNPCIHTVNL